LKSNHQIKSLPVGKTGLPKPILTKETVALPTKRAAQSANSNPLLATPIKKASGKSNLPPTSAVAKRLEFNMQLDIRPPRLFDSDAIFEPRKSLDARLREQLDALIRARSQKYGFDFLRGVPLPNVDGANDFSYELIEPRESRVNASRPSFLSEWGRGESSFSRAFSQPIANFECDRLIAKTSTPKPKMKNQSIKKFLLNPDQIREKYKMTDQICAKAKNIEKNTNEDYGLKNESLIDIKVSGILEETPKTL